MLRAAITAFLLTLLVALPGEAQRRYRAEPDPQSPAGIPYQRYFTRDKYNRRITFYVSGNPRERLPLVTVVLGSGAFSNFRREGERIVDAHGTVRQAFAAKAHVVVVEKPGVAFLEQPAHGNGDDFPGSISGSAEFQRESALPRWVEAVSAALQAARRLPQADPKRILIIGHSEGALVAAMVAAENSFVTHVASLAGNGPSVLFELMHKAREGRLYASLANDPEKQMAQIEADIAAVHADPLSTTRQAVGHSHIYWSSRWPHSTIDALSRTRSRIFIAHGTADRNVSIENFDLMYAQLLASAQDIKAMRVEGADHGFRIAADGMRDVWGDVIGKLRNWFLE